MHSFVKKRKENLIRSIQKRKWRFLREGTIIFKERNRKHKKAKFLRYFCVHESCESLKSKYFERQKFHHFKDSLMNKQKKWSKVGQTIFYKIYQNFCRELVLLLWFFLCLFNVFMNFFLGTNKIKCLILHLLINSTSISVHLSCYSLNESEIRYNLSFSHQITLFFFVFHAYFIFSI